MHRNASLAFELLLRALLCRLRNVRERLGKLVIYIHTRMRAIQIFACYGFSTQFPRRKSFALLLPYSHRFFYWEFPSPACTRPKYICLYCCWQINTAEKSSEWISLISRSSNPGPLFQRFPINLSQVFFFSLLDELSRPCKEIYHL